MTLKLKSVAVIMAALASNSFASTELIDRISFNQLEQYSGYYSPGSSWTSIVDGIVEIRPWKQRWNNNADSPYTYSTEEDGSIFLELDSWLARGKVSFDQTYTVRIKVWEFDSKSKDKTNLELLHFDRSNGIETLYKRNAFGKKEYLEFDVTGQVLKNGLKIVNTNIAIDEIHLYQKDDTKTKLIDFEHISSLKHGSIHNTYQESKGIGFSPINQRAGTHNQQTFTYGNTNAKYHIQAFDTKDIDEEATYRIEMMAGSATGKSRNYRKINLSLTSYKGLVHKYGGDELFGVSWDHFAFNVSGKELINGLYLNNALVKLDDISIRKINGTSRLKALSISVSDLNNDGDYKDHGELVGSYNDGKIMHQVMTNAGYDTNYRDSVSEKDFINELDKAVEETSPGGTLFVSLSGHLSGTGQFSLNDEQVSAKQIKERLDRFKGRVVLFYDSCGSESAIQHFKNDSSYLTMASSSVNEPSWQENYTQEVEGSDLAKASLKPDSAGQYHMGNSTYFIGEGAGAFNANNLPADANGDNVVTFIELFEYVKPRVANRLEGSRFSQTAVMYAPENEQHFPLLDYRNY